MVKADSRLNFYHFGWRSDINRNIDNNFDEGTSTGRKFPAVQFHVPENTSISQNGLDYYGLQEDIQITLYFDDLQDYNNNSTEKIDTLLEQWTNLKTIAEDFVLNFEKVIVEKYGVGHIDSEIKFIPRSNLHNDKLITWEVSFLMNHITPCTLEENQVDLLALPSRIESFDLENYKKGFVNEASFDLDGVNEYIKAPNNNVFNFEWSDTFSFEFWVFVPNVSNVYLYSNWWDQTGVFLRVGGGGGLRFKMCSGANIGGRCLDIFTNGGVFDFGVWNHVVITNNGGGVVNSPTLYVNTNIIPFSNIDNQPIAAPWSIKQAIRPFELGANTFFGIYSEAYFNVCRAWDIVLSSSDVNSLNDDGCPTFPVQEDNLIWDMNPSDSTWNGSSFDVVDRSGTQPDFDSVLMEEEDLILVTPC